MACDWPIRTLAECASSEPYSTQIGPFGKALMAHEYTEHGVPVLRGVNVNRGRFHDDDFVFIEEEAADRLSKFESYPGDVLFVHKGTLGQIGLMPRKRKHPRYIMGNSMMRVRCDPTKLLPEYLYYWLSSTEGQHYLFSRISQVGVPQLQTPLATLRQAALPVPSLPEQVAIAHILGTLDDKIELNRRMNETLEAMARALFKSWFVDFDPVRAKVDGERSFPGMSQCIFDGLPFRFAASPIGYVPAGWRVVCVGDMADINAWTLNDSDDLQRVEYVEISGVERGEVGTVSVYERGSEPSRARRRVRHGDTVISTVRPERGTYFLCLNPSPSLIVSTGFAVISPRSAPWSFVHAAMTREEVFERLGQLADGAAYPAVRPQVIAATELVLPTAAEMLTEFHSSSSPLFERTDVNRHESRRLVAIRDVLLPKLLSGEIRVKDAERLVERAV